MSRHFQVLPQINIPCLILPVTAQLKIYFTIKYSEKKSLINIYIYMITIYFRYALIEYLFIFINLFLILVVCLQKIEANMCENEGCHLHS